MELDVFGKKVVIDIAYGGNFFAIVDFQQLGLTHSIQDVDSFIRYGKEIRDQVNHNIKIQHPIYPYINWVNDILFTGNPAFPRTLTRAWCSWARPRSTAPPAAPALPPGWACSTERACSSGRGFPHESVLGTVFEGSVGPDVKVGDYDAIIPLVKSRGFIIGTSNLIIDEADPVKYGFCSAES